MTDRRDSHDRTVHPRLVDARRRGEKPQPPQPEVLWSFFSRQPHSRFASLRRETIRTAENGKVRHKDELNGGDEL